MKVAFSKLWKRSTQPRKQRKYRFNIPMHARKEQLSAHLAKPLREKYGTRSTSLRVGDKVRVLRGTHKGKEGAVERIDAKEYQVFVAKVETIKREGSKAPYPLTPSNLMIIDVANDKRRFKNTTKEAKAKPTKE